MAKQSTMVMLIATLFFGTPDVSASDFTLPRFLPGDVVSSDFFNDIMDRLTKARKTVTADDLVGTWKCVSYVPEWSWRDDVVNGWVTGADSLYFMLSSTITFSDDGDGTYSFGTTAPNPFRADNANSISSPYAVVGNLFYCSNDCAQAPYDVNKISDTKIQLVNQTSSYTTLMCDKQALPPLPPSDLAATVSKKTVSLSWADNSTDETGFKIFRKETFDGAWSEIGSVGADTTSYEDTVTSDGKYWYRIFAVNDNGDSFGSNVIKVTIE